MKKIKDLSSRLFYSVCLFSCLLWISACGALDGLNDNLEGIGTPEEVVQTEVYNVMNQTQSAILNGLMASIMGKASGTNIKVGNCQPEMSMGIGGVTLEFESSLTCPLDGTINITMAPLGAQVDISVVGLNYIEALRFQADLKVERKDGGVQVSWLFTSGTIELKSNDILPFNGFAVNGKSTTFVKRGQLDIESRTNLFESTTGIGRAIVSEFHRKNKQNTRQIQFCKLAGGQENNPDAGFLSDCVSR